MLIAVVGMPGSGKSVATEHLESISFCRIRFGDITDEEVERRGLKLNEENERAVRESLRKEHGMSAYAKLNVPRIDKMLGKGKVVIDGLYSWEEYEFLREKYPKMIVIAVYSSPETRYHRLGRREVRPLDEKECASRDKAQLENLHTGGPIAMADFTIVNEGSVNGLKKKVDDILLRIQ